MSSTLCKQQGRRYPRLLLAALVALSATRGTGKVCSHDWEDCTHTGCCKSPGKKCYKKNFHFAACLDHCAKGIHHQDPPHFRHPWSCELVDAQHPDCASHHENCMHEGCCKDKSLKCIIKNPAQAFCRKSTPEGWLGHVIHPHVPKHDASNHHGPHGGGGGGGGKKHNEDLSQGWKHGLKGTHYWDCNGAGCDAAFLNPWDLQKYVSPPEYAPLDPNDHGGPLYGEKIWMTGAANDQVSQSLGPDANNCGADNAGGGGCGQCLLVKNAASNQPSWTVIIMKKNRCPPHSNGCNPPNYHMDFAVPGFDNLQYSTANCCGERAHTHLTKQASAICGSTQPGQCNCHGIPGHTKGGQMLQKGCNLFKQWGWHSGVPTIDFRPVPCPKNFVKVIRIGAAFGSGGVINKYDMGNASGLTVPAAPSVSGGTAGKVLRKSVEGVAFRYAPLLGLVCIGLTVVSGRAMFALHRRRRGPASVLAEGSEPLAATE